MTQSTCNMGTMYILLHRLLFSTLENFRYHQTKIICHSLPWNQQFEQNQACSKEMSYFVRAMLIININKTPLESSEVHKLRRMVNFFLSLHQLLSISKKYLTLLAAIINIFIKFDQSNLNIIFFILTVLILP